MQSVNLGSEWQCIGESTICMSLPRLASASTRLVSNSEHQNSFVQVIDIPVHLSFRKKYLFVVVKGTRSYELLSVFRCLTNSAAIM